MRYVAAMAGPGPADTVLIAVVATSVLWSLHMYGFGLPAAARLGVARPLRPIVACALVFVEGYVAFWGYFAARWLGTVAIVLLTSAAVIGSARRARSWGTAKRLRPLTEPDWAILMIAIGTLFLALLLLFHDGRSVDLVASDRFVAHLPVDNQIPRLFADRLQQGRDPRHLLGDWLSSDRPPLQTGFILLLRPVVGSSGMRSDATAFAASYLFQLAWVPAVWGLARTLKARRTLSAFVVATVACTGFALQESIYTWPKLGGAALSLGALALVLDRGRNMGVRHALLVGVMAAGAPLAHGGLMFSTICTAGVFLLPRYRPSRRALLAAIASLAVVSASWSAYQKWVEPPGNRLLKWHLAGVKPIDDRGVLETVKDEYARIGLATAARYKADNFHTLVAGETRPRREKSSAEPDHLATTVLDLSGPVEARRRADFSFLVRAVAWAPVAALAALALSWRDRRRGRSHDPIDHVGVLTAWSIGTVVVWSLMMFGPNTTVVQQGSYAPVLVLIALPFLVLASLRPRQAVGIAFAQAVTFVTTWAPASTASGTRLRPDAVVLTVIAAVVVAVALLAPLAARRKARVSPAPFGAH